MNGSVISTTIAPAFDHNKNQETAEYIPTILVIVSDIVHDHPFQAQAPILPAQAAVNRIYLK